MEQLSILFLRKKELIHNVFSGIFDEMGEKETGICVGRAEMELMSGQCVVINSSSNALYRAATQFRPASPLPIVNLLSLRDSNYISLVALEQGRLAAHHSQSLCKVMNNCLNFFNLIV